MKKCRKADKGSSCWVSEWPKSPKYKKSRKMLTSMRSIELSVASVDSLHCPRKDQAADASLHWEETSLDRRLPTSAHGDHCLLPLFWLFFLLLLLSSMLVLMFVVVVLGKLPLCRDLVGVNEWTFSRRWVDDIASGGVRWCVYISHRVAVMTGWSGRCGPSKLLMCVLG